MPATKKGSETRVVKSIRIEPSVFRKIVDKYGSLSEWINLMIKKDEKLTRKKP